MNSWTDSPHICPYPFMTQGGLGKASGLFPSFSLHISTLLNLVLVCVIGRKNNVLSPEDLHPNSWILGLWRKYLCSWRSVKGFCNAEIVLCYPGVLVSLSCCCDNMLGQKQLEKQRIYFNSRFIAGSEVKVAGSGYLKKWVMLHPQAEKRGVNMLANIQLAFLILYSLDSPAQELSHL